VEHAFNTDMIRTFRVMKAVCY